MLLATKYHLLEVPSNSKYVDDSWRLGGNSQHNQCHRLCAPSSICSWGQGEWTHVVNLRSFEPLHSYLAEKGEEMSQEVFLLSTLNEYMRISVYRVGGAARLNKD